MSPYVSKAQAFSNTVILVKLNVLSLGCVARL